MRTYIVLDWSATIMQSSWFCTASEPLLLPAAASISPRASYCTSYQSSYGSPPGEGAAGVRSPGEIPPGGSGAGRAARHSRRGSTVDDSTLGGRSKDDGDEQALINRINNVVRTVPSACPGPEVCSKTPSAKLSAASKAQAALCIITPCGISLGDWNFRTVKPIRAAVQSLKSRKQLLSSGCCVRG